MKILLIAMSGIGDTLIATPLIHELRANFPNAQIDVLVMWAGAKDLICYFETESAGGLVYRSLFGKLPPASFAWGRITSVKRDGDTFYFASHRGVLRLSRGENMVFWPEPDM